MPKLSIQKPTSWPALVILLTLFGCDRPSLGTTSPPPSGDVPTNPPGDLPVTPPGDAISNDIFVNLDHSMCQDQPFLTAQTLQTDDRVETLLDLMSLADKVDQMAGFSAGAELFATPDNEAVGVRGFKFRDGPRGVRLENGTATCFPVPMARSASWDLDLERRIGVAMGAEVRGLGHNLLLAPCVNTLRHPGWGRAQETYGEDPWFLGKMGAAFTQGTQTQVPACVKHMAGNNIEDTRMTNDAIIDEQNLRENYMRQYRMVIQEADVACVMSAYNQVNGAYSSENKHLLSDILRDEWGYDGFVVSDWFATKTTVESALAGLDVEMPWRAHYAGLELAVDSGQVSEEIIDKAVERILRIKFKFGFALLNETYAGDPSVVESPEHIALALEAAHKGTVLLKNEGSALPLSREDGKTIAVVGEWSKIARLGDNGSSRVDPSYAIDPYTGIKARAGDGVTVVQSEDSSAAQGADVVIVVAALTQQDEGEAWNGGGDRDTLDLSSEDEALINEVAQMVDTVIVIIEAGGPITMNAWKDSADAIVMAWYPGMEGGHALGDLIFGDVNFSGRLTQTWPKTWDDEPVFGNHQAKTVFEYLHGYRHFDGNEIEPLFPFGFGLSYTSFEYSNLSIPCDEVTTGAVLTVSFDVTNTGDRAGTDVPQLYVGYPNTQVRRPLKELKGFARVELGVGETQRVSIPVRISDLAYYDVDQSAWVVEKVAHTIHIGPNATTMVLSTTVPVGDEGRARLGSQPPAPADVVDTTASSDADPADQLPDASNTEDSPVTTDPGQTDLADLADPPVDTTPPPEGTYSVTFQVDMTGIDPQYLWSGGGGVHLQADFNGWCGLCNPLQDDDGDTVWSLTMWLLPGDYKYNYTTSGWTGLTDEPPPECSTEGNRTFSVTDSAVILPVHYFDRCPNDGQPPPTTTDVKFTVEASGVDTLGGVYLKGEFNGWCPDCLPLNGPNDGRWHATVPLLPGGYQYKYSNNGWGGAEENLSTECDPWPDDGYNNRYVTVQDTTLILPEDSFGQCTNPMAPNKPLVTFEVDMTGIYTGGGVHLHSEFNSWCGDCAPMENPNGDNIWTLTLPLDPGTYQYQYRTSGWTGLVEAVPAECDLFPDDGYGNRYVVTNDLNMNIPVHYFNRCIDDGLPAPSPVNVTFQVDMTGLQNSDTVYLQGNFNGWCGLCFPLTLTGGELWSVTIPLLPGTYEYKYTTNGWDGLQETVPGACDLIPDDENYNRYVIVGESDQIIPLHPWETCP